MQEALVPALAAAVASAAWTTARKPADTTERVIQGVFIVCGVTTAVGLAAALVTRHPVALGLAVVAGAAAHLAARRCWPDRSATALHIQAVALIVVAFVGLALGV